MRPTRRDSAPLRLQPGLDPPGEPVADIPIGVEALLAGGAERVVVGSLAVRDPELVIGWIERFGADHITVALDTRTAADGTWVLPVAGWTEVEGGADLTTMLHQYADAGLDADAIVETVLKALRHNSSGVAEARA